MVVLGGLIGEQSDQQKSRTPVIDKIRISVTFWAGPRKGHAPEPSSSYS
ncbi:hypothetical protein [Hyphomicrobium sp. 99]|nr:hypothetical protein [Hyphomicrobium sp. 99]